MFTFFYRSSAPTNFAEAKESDTKRYAKSFWNLLENGIYTAPSQFETNFVNFAHTDEDLTQAREAFLRTLRS
jgi:glutamate-1-semialdehyde 2,1-aminomutase